MAKRFTNPYHPSMERLWRLGGLDDVQLTRRQWAIFGLCSAVGALWAVSIPLTLILAFWTLAGEAERALPLLSGFSALCLGLGWAFHRLCDFAQIGKTASPVSALGLEEDLARARESVAAREWEKDAYLSGRDLRFFDVYAMKRLAELEKEGALTGRDPKGPARH